MIKLTKYDAATGRIMGTVEVPESMVELQGDNWLEPQAGVSEATHYVDVEAKVYVAMPPRPSPAHQFDFTAKAWIDRRSLNQLREAKWQQIKAQRSAIEFGTFTYNGMVFDGDLDAQRRLATYISVSKSAVASGTPFEVDFILADNSTVKLTAADFINIEMTKVNQVAAAFSHAVTRREEIYAAQSRESLEAIVW